MHMRIEGDAVNDLQEIFLTIWNKETKQNVGGAAYFPLHENKTDSTDIIVAIVDRTPKKNSRMLSHLVDPTKCAYKFIRHKKTFTS